MLIQENVNLKNFNTFHTSTHTKYFCEVTSIDDMLEALNFCQQKKIPFIIIGQGSNILFKQDYIGLIIELNIKGIDLVDQTEDHFYVKAKCGENWHDFVQFCLQQNYYGLENLSLIPGTVGAAPVPEYWSLWVELSEFFMNLKPWRFHP